MSFHRQNYFPGRVVSGKYETPARLVHEYSPYLSSYSGDPKSPYDLNRSGAILEIKKALVAIARQEDSFNPNRNTLWKQIREDDYWSQEVADEFACMVGRYKGLGIQVPGPYAMISPIGLQPTPTGLEILAGAVTSVVDDWEASSMMPLYMEWRDGYFDPPSMMSGPSSDDQCIATVNLDPSFKHLSPDSSTEFKTQVSLIESQLLDLWKKLAEGGLDDVQINDTIGKIQTLRAQRSEIIGQSLSTIPPRQGETIVNGESSDSQNSNSRFLIWGAVAVGAIGLGLFLFSDKKRR